jgi:aerobic carbon-monoxide dehydrogenase medium subunit
MKPAPFAYHDPTRLDEALALLAAKENARVLAGGQSLIPMLNFRYLQPDDIIDVNRIAELAGITRENGALRIGAMTRQRDVEFSDAVAKDIPLMREAVLQVGHRQTRNRGTVGGSLAHLDPAAELPLVACALDATVHAASVRGAREIVFTEYAQGFMSPALEPDEMVTAVSFPVWGNGSAFVEFARREGDFAIVAVAAQLELSGGTIKRAAVALGGMGPTYIRARDAEAALTGAKAGPEAFRAAAEACANIEAIDDIHAPGSYRQHLAGVLVRRALERACTRVHA